MGAFRPGPGDRAGSVSRRARDLKIVTVAGAFNIQKEIILARHIIGGTALERLARAVRQVDGAPP